MNNNQYKSFLQNLAEHIQTARLKAVLSVNQQMIQLYWEIGRFILQQQSEEGWGTKVIDRLSKDLRLRFPDMKGLSARNLKYMRKFAAAYPNFTIVQPVVAQISWTHNIILLDKFREDIITRFWYMRQSLENGWSKRILIHQIDLEVHKTQGKLPNNFKSHLPPPQSDMVRQIFKDEYIFDFLAQSAIRNEQALEENLTQYITEFLLALGKGFAFIGRQYHLEVGGQDFYIDLLFYHVRLHCYIVVELKSGVFKPEYTGKLNFYLSAVDDLVRQPIDKPTIGLLLCRYKNDILVEYALRDVNKPMGVASYRLTKKISSEMEKNLPSEAELKQILQMINLKTDKKA